MPGVKIEDLRFSSSSMDDFLAIDRPQAKVASVAGRIRIASLHHLSSFRVVAEDTLVHVSQQDFWKLGQDKEGYFIERLVDDGEGPVKG